MSLPPCLSAEGCHSRQCIGINHQVLLLSLGSPKIKVLIQPRAWSPVGRALEQNWQDLHVRFRLSGCTDVTQSSGHPRSSPLHNVFVLPVLKGESWAFTWIDVLTPHSVFETDPFAKSLNFPEPSRVLRLQVSDPPPCPVYSI